MTKDEALKLALEALEALEALGTAYLIHSDAMLADKIQQAIAEIAAMRAQLQLQPEPDACKHEWLRTGAMEPGECRCIKCGAWNATTPQLKEPLQFAGLSITEIRLPVGMTLRFENGALIIEAAHGIQEDK